jgi:hypothetical protein
MANDANSQIDIGVVMTPNTGPGADAAISDINRVKVAEGEAATTSTEAAGATEAASQQAAAAVEEGAAAQSRARQVAEQYQVSLFVAAQALDLLGAASGTAAIGSAELDAAIESATRSTAEAAEQRAAYNATLRASTEAMLEEVAALDADASTEERRAVLTDAVTAALQRMGITEAEVALQAQKLNASYEGTARAMVAIKQAELATEVSAIRGELEGTTVAATQSATGIEAVGAQLAQTGTQRHVLTSIREIARGGAYEIRGEAEASFLLGRALDSIIPGVGIFIAIASGIALVTQVLEEHAEKADAAAEKVSAKQQELSDGADTLARNVKQWEAAAVASYDAIGQAADRATKAVEAHTLAIRNQQRARDELNDAELAARLAQLDQQEIEAEKGKSPEEKADIARNFDLQRLNMRQQRTQEKANEEAKSAQQEIDRLNTDNASLKGDLAKKAAAFQNLQDQVTSAKIGLIGVSDDAELAESQLAALQKKQFGPDGLSPDEQQRMEQLQRTVPQLEIDKVKNGPSYESSQNAKAIEGVPGSGGLQSQLDEQLAIEKEALQYLSRPGMAKIAADARAAADRLADQITAIGQYQALLAATGEASKKYTEAVSANADKITANNDQISANTTELLAKQLNVTTVALSGYVAQQKLTDKNAGDRAKQDFKDRDADRYARRKGFETISEDPTVSPDERAAAKNQVDRIDAASIADKLAHAIALGISEAEQTKLKADIAAYQNRGVQAIQGQNIKDHKVESTDARRALDEAEKAAEAATRAHPELMKGLKGITDVTLRNAALTEELANSIDPALRAIGQRLQRAENAINSLKNNHQS